MSIKILKIGHRILDCDSEISKIRKKCIVLEKNTIFKESAFTGRTTHLTKICKNELGRSRGSSFLDLFN
jgi:hypothetical protein